MWAQEPDTGSGECYRNQQAPAIKWQWFSTHGTCVPSPRSGGGRHWVGGYTEASGKVMLGGRGEFLQTPARPFNPSLSSHAILSPTPALSCQRCLSLWSLSHSLCLPTNSGSSPQSGPFRWRQFHLGFLSWFCWLGVCLEAARGEHTKGLNSDSWSPGCLCGATRKAEGLEQAQEFFLFSETSSGGDSRFRASFSQITKHKSSIPSVHLSLQLPLPRSDVSSCAFPSCQMQQVRIPVLGSL